MSLCESDPPLSEEERGISSVESLLGGANIPDSIDNETMVRYSVDYRLISTNNYTRIVKYNKWLGKMYSNKN